MQKHLHVIGICGVATSALAIAFHDRGWKVTGSDKGFYPPVSTHLTEAGISYYAGWHPEKMAAAERPDIVVAGASGTSLSNPEIMYAKEQNIPILSFAEALGKYIVKENSIVTTGTWGKTTISSILSFILIEAGLDPSYFTGGVSLSHKTAAITESKWSVVEGDEYQAAIWDKKPKFAYYVPTHLLLTSVSWDHADLYPTENSYFKVFEELVKKIPASGKLVICKDDAGVKKVLADAGTAMNIKPITYGQTLPADYYFHSIEHTKNGILFSIDHNGQSHRVSSPMLGRFNAENIAGCFAMAHEIGIVPEKIIAAIAKFKGIKRRLEKRLESKTDITVLDCHAPTPEKATSVLESIREVYDKRIIAIYEPNIGGRQKSSIDMYNNAFKDADTVIIPHLTKLKVDMSADADTKDQPIDGPQLTEFISKTHSATEYIEDDEALVKKVTALVVSGDVIVFLGSHGFRGMIEEVVKRLQ